MKIGIDCRTILHPEKGECDGIGHYTYQLVRHLLKIDKKNTYVLFFDHSIGRSKIAKFKQKNVLIKFVPFLQYSNLMPEKYSHFLVSAAFSREKLNILHSPIPWLPRPYIGKTIVTVHDLAVCKFFELYSKQKQDILFRKNLPSILDKARRIIAVSKSTSKDLKEIFNINSKKIRVIYHGVDKRFFKRNTLSKIKQVKNKYKIKKDYLFSLSDFGPRKNITRIIFAYERLRKRVESVKNKVLPEYQLVLGGSKKDPNFKKIKQVVGLSKYKKDIIFTNYIEASDLNALFEGASLFMFPSLYEGFGLPIIEAMAKGVPVITSNTSSMEEIAGKSAVIVDPYNVSEITAAAYNLLTDKKLYDKFKVKGKLLAQKFKWDKCARETLSFYQRAINSN
ncbi:hypothetical protein B6D52_00330 [Candidatus Parcubacteria bacterium 4484_255]|nr:MAG: hypothetical protein B6D52_00330 [Candidatus Parcubacteria bacterium 4484_255]